MIEGLTAIEVADRLGVEVATVYAYVSRGALTRVGTGSHRDSRYDADEVEELARRARPRSARRGRSGVDVVIGTLVSEIGDGWIRYRDHDLMALTSRPYEDIAHLLWTGSLPQDPEDWLGAWVGEAGARRGLVDRAGRGLPASAGVTARLTVAAMAAGTMCPQSIDPDTAPHHAAGLVDALVESLPPLRPTQGSGGAASPLAHRLWYRFSPLRPTPANVRALNLALVLLAEHELATSTLAVRVAASTGAGLPEVLLAGLGTVSGPRHGKAAVAVHHALLEADSRTRRDRVGDAAAGPSAGHGKGPSDPLAAGRGHLVHRHGDPRFAPLWESARELASPRRREVLDDAARHRTDVAPPNVDAALGALAYVSRAEPGSTEAVFAIARCAGWLAHAIEESDEAPLRFRGRTLYRGRAVRS